MKVKPLYVIASLLAAAIPLSSLRCESEPTVAVTSPAKETAPTIEDILNKRGAARRELMLHSLKGIRGLAYGVIHSENAADLEKGMLEKLKQLNMPLCPFSALKAGVKPVDALVEVKVSKVPNANYVQLNVIQWVSLLRSPKTEVRAVTYHDSMLSEDADLSKAVDQLTDQFVIDLLKANQQPSVDTQTKAPVHKKR